MQIITSKYDFQIKQQNLEPEYEEGSSTEARERRQGYDENDTKGVCELQGKCKFSLMVFKGQTGKRRFLRRVYILCAAFCTCNRGNHGLQRDFCNLNISATPTHTHVFF